MRKKLPTNLYKKKNGNNVTLKKSEHSTNSKFLRVEIMDSECDSITENHKLVDLYI